MRILVFNWQDRRHPRAGGAEVHLHEVFGRLARRGHAVTVLASRWTGAPARESLDGLEVLRVGSRVTYPAAAWRCWRSRLADRGYDVVVEDLNKIALFASRWVHVPVAVIAHHLFGRSAFLAADPATAAATVLSERLVGLAYRRAWFQAVSSSTARELAGLGIPPSRIAIVQNGLDTGFFHPARATGRAAVPTFAYVGRLARYKRLDVLLRAAARLAAAGLTFRVRIAGTGDDLPRLSRLARSLGLQRHVTFLGYVGEETKRDLYRRAWAHVVLSAKEGWGISCAEAAACGTPSVVSNVPGLRDVVRQSRTGIIVPYGDPVATADALASLVRRPEVVDRLGAAAAARASRYTWDRAARDTEEHLSALVEGRAPAAGDWSLLEPRYPFSEAPLPRDGPPDLPFGAEQYHLVCRAAGGPVPVNVLVGSPDPGGHDCVLVIRWNGGEVREDLEGRPIDALVFALGRVSRLIGPPLESRPAAPMPLPSATAAGQPGRRPHPPRLAPR